jgi:hypothetical protein
MRSRTGLAMAFKRPAAFSEAAIIGSAGGRLAFAFVASRFIGRRVIMPAHIRNKTIGIRQYHTPPYVSGEESHRPT